MYLGIGADGNQVVRRIGSKAGTNVIDLDTSLVCDMSDVSIARLYDEDLAADGHTAMARPALRAANTGVTTPSPRKDEVIRRRPGFGLGMSTSRNLAILYFWRCTRLPIIGGVRRMR